MKFQFYILTIVTLMSLYIVALASPGAHGPNGEHLDQAPTQSNSTIGRQADGSILMPMKHQAMLGIETQFAVQSEESKHIQLEGLVKPHPDGFAVIQPSSDGRLEAPEQGMPLTGSTVKAGDILGYIRYQYTAFDRATQRSELVKVRNQIEQAKRDVERLERLGDLASQQELEQLATQLTILKQQATVLRQGLEKSEALIAPITGVLRNNGISRGQWVEAGKTVFTIMSNEQFMVEASIPHPELLPKLTDAKMIQAPSFELTFVGFNTAQVNGLTQANFVLQQSASADKKVYSGQFQSTLPVVMNQPVTLRAVIDETITGIVLPDSAIVLSRNNLPQVWIKLSAERFLPQIIEYQVLEPGLVIVTNGLGEDNRVVVSGTSLLNQVR